MDKTFGDLFRSAEESPSYWAQAALLEFLQILDSLRKSRGNLSQRNLAKLVGVSPATLSRWLNGTENITVSTMCRLAMALGAAVHIHVADKKDKGRWRPEAGLAHIRNANKTTETSSSSQASGMLFSSWRPSGSAVEHPRIGTMAA